MSNITDLQSEINSRQDIEGFMDRFNTHCLHAIDPGLINLIYYKADMTGEKFNKPKYADGTLNPHWPTEDGKPVDPPRDKDERKEFFDNVKQGHITEWLSRVRSGEFDDNKVVTPKQDTPVQDAVQDVTNLDMGMDDEDCMETCDGEPCPNGKECDLGDEPIKEGVEIAKEKPDSPRLPEDTKSPGTELLRALDDYIASTDSPPEDNPKVDAILGDFQTAILRLGKEVNALKEEVSTITTTVESHSTAINTLTEKLVGALKKVPEMIKEEILKKFSS
jgi:hypothetical protein